MSAEITARVEKDRSKATLVIQPGFDQSMLTPMTLLAIATGAGVHVDQSVEQAVEEFVAQYTPGADSVEVSIAALVPPRAGKDGWIEWADGYDPEGAGSVDGGEAASMDHYLGKDYIRVSPEDVIGVLHEPTDGVDGRDVLGGCIKAPPGKSLKIKFHSTVRLEPDGRIISNAEGVISLLHDALEISKQLVIPDCVDFSSGHIDFAGSVMIKNAIRTGFNVAAEGDVHVGGLIEVATVACQGDLIAKQGMAGKGKGTIEVGGNVDATYLEEVIGSVRGDLVIRNSLIGCNLEINKDLDCATGAIRGGELAIAGVLKAKLIGAESAPPTRICLGQSPSLQSILGAARARIQETGLVLAEHQNEYNKLSSIARLSSEDKERATELMFEMEEAEEVLSEASVNVENTQEKINQSRMLDVQVSGRIFSGVTLEIGEQLIKFESDVAGPITIFWGDDHQVLCKVGSGESKAIESIAKVYTKPSAEAA